MPIVEPLPNIPLALDNNILDGWRRQQHGVLIAITDYIARFKTPPALPAIVVFEMMDGFHHAIAKAGQITPLMQQALTNTKNLTQLCPILEFNNSAANIAGFITGHLSRNISKNDLNDVFIAATVLAHGYGIVTRNRKDFELIANHLPTTHPVLYLTNWKI